jgi:GntR family transcriptional regulator, transcriptional repressor for pyruvate dehydrogenase complex
MLTPVKRRSLSDAVFEQLREQIVLGRFEAGSPLPAERELAETLNVNRGALREALKRLEQARLISIQHGGGTKVLDFRRTAGLDLLSELLVDGSGNFDITVARSVIEMRTAIAPDIARLCAERGGIPSATELDRIVAEMKKSKGDLEKLQSLAMDFWATLVDGSHNVAYRLVFNTLRETYGKLRDLLLDTLADELGYIAGYTAVAKAVRAKDPKTAEKKARQIVHRGMKKLLEMLATVEALAHQEEK